MPGASSECQRTIYGIGMEDTLADEESGREIDLPSRSKSVVVDKTLASMANHLAHTGVSKY